MEGEENGLNAFSTDSRLSRWTSSQPQAAGHEERLKSARSTLSGALWDLAASGHK
jgi:hypothetical protein